MSMNIHATCIELNSKGILLLGDSGAGKSDLALRLIMRYKGMLVADDRVEVDVEDNKITACAPTILQGLIEVRGVGIIKMPHQPKTEISAVFDLISAYPERLPEKMFHELLGQKLPLFQINPFESSAPEKVVTALSLL